MILHLNNKTVMLIKNTAVERYPQFEENSFGNRNRTQELVHRVQKYIVWLYHKFYYGQE